MTDASTPGVESTPEPARDHAATLWLVDSDGFVLERRGAEAGPAPGEDLAELPTVGVGQELVTQQVAGGAGDERLLAVVPAAAAEAARELAGMWAESRLQETRLLEDLESMSATGATLMEADHVHAELMRELAVCEDEDGPYWIAVRSLARACGFARAAFVRLQGDTGVVVAESVFDAEVGEHVDASAEQIGRSFDARRGSLARLLDCRDPWVLQRAEGLDAGEIPVASPESGVEHDVLAARVTYSSLGGDVLLGAVVCVDRRPDDYRVGKPFGTDTASLVENLAGTIALRVGSSSMAAYQKELSLAHEIQQQILPSAAPRIDGYEIAGSCRTYGDVGGDYLDYLPMADGRLLALVADVSGHNLASGMIMVGARSAMRVLAAMHEAPGEVFTGLLETLYPDLSHTERFITAAGLALRPGENEVQIVNAGHNPTMIFRARQGAVERIAGEDPILGFLPGLEYAECTVQLEPGDVALIYTDGVTEAARPDGEMFGEDRLEATLLGCSSSPPEQILDAIHASLTMFTDTGSIEDDVTIVAIKRTDTDSASAAAEGEQERT